MAIAAPTIHVGARKLVEAAGQFAPHLSMRPGLCLHPNSRVRGVLSGQFHGRILVPARALKLGEPMSLYRAALRLARLLPLGVARALPGSFCQHRKGSPM